MGKCQKLERDKWCLKIVCLRGNTRYGNMRNLSLQPWTAAHFDILYGAKIANNPSTARVIYMSRSYIILPWSNSTNMPFLGYDCFPARH